MNIATKFHTLTVAALLALVTAGAQSATISVEVGSVGNIVLNGVSTVTVGSQVDPWTIAETYNASGTLQFSSDQTGGPLGNSNTTGAPQSRGKWVSKKVTNNTADIWTSFELELQSLLGTPSTQGDGLSFADGSALTALFSSDVFGGYTRQDVLRDYINFSGGSVAPGQMVTFNFVITDNGGNDPFYLLQTANKSDVPEPGSLALLALALGGVAVARRRR